jgi:hypothetical protein
VYEREGVFKKMMEILTVKSEVNCPPFDGTAGVSRKAQG